MKKTLLMLVGLMFLGSTTLMAAEGAVKVNAAPGDQGAVQVKGADSQAGVKTSGKKGNKKSGTVPVGQKGAVQVNAAPGGDKGAVKVNSADSKAGVKVNAKGGKKSGKKKGGVKTGAVEVNSK